MNSESVRNPLAFESIPKLILKFSLPTVLSFLINAVYSIVDQIYLGQSSAGMLGIAATNVAFPLMTITTALALLLSVGSCSGFNLRQGAGKPEEAARVAGGGLFLMAAGGVILAVAALALNPVLLSLFGATPDILPYSRSYMLIISCGIPLQVMTTGCTQLARSDGSPGYSMRVLIIGAVLNSLLDPLFIFVLKMGVSGAALATVLSQVVTCYLSTLYIRKSFRSVRIKREYIKFDAGILKIVASLGMAASANQLAMAIVQVVMNNTLVYYGGLSEYGAEIPLACAGAISKLNVVFLAFTIGIAQGCQPINGYNYGAGNFLRVRKTYIIGTLAATAFGCAVFAVFQLFPHVILGIFSSGSAATEAAYFKFGERFIRIFLFLMFANGIQPVTSNFLTSIGKARVGIFISLTKNIIFFLPLIIIFPLIWGIDGVVYAGPIADAAAVVTAGSLGGYQIWQLTIKSRQLTESNQKQKKV